jgi:hypothetical protein
VKDFSINDIEQNIINKGLSPFTFIAFDAVQLMLKSQIVYYADGQNKRLDKQVDN